MMNKGLELIEAFHLFPVGGKPDRDRRPSAVGHPQPRLLRRRLGAGAIGRSRHARRRLHTRSRWPDRMQAPAPRLRLAEVGQLTFEAPDEREISGAAAGARGVAAAGSSRPSFSMPPTRWPSQSFLSGGDRLPGYSARSSRRRWSRLPMRPARMRSRDVIEIDQEARRDERPLHHRQALLADSIDPRLIFRRIPSNHRGDHALHRRLDLAFPDRADRARSSCTSSAITWSRGCAASWSKSSRSASARSCSAGPTGHGTRWKSAPFRSAATSRCTARMDFADEDAAVRRRADADDRRLFPPQDAEAAGGHRLRRPARQFPVRPRRYCWPVHASSAHRRPCPSVGSVQAGSAAGQAGLMPGDVIIEIDGEKIAWFEDIRRIVNATSRGARCASQ